jgi:hypothetical protein
MTEFKGIKTESKDFINLAALNPIQHVSVSDHTGSMLVGFSEMEVELGHIRAELEKERAGLEAKEKGIQVDRHWKSDGRHAQYLSFDDIKETLGIWDRLGMQGTSYFKIAEFFAEPDEGFSKLVKDRGVIVSRVSDRFTILEYQTFLNRCLAKLSNQDQNNPDIKDQIKHFQVTKEYIDNAALNPENNPEKDIVMFQKIVVLHPLETDQIDKRIIWSYMPQVMIDGLGKEELQSLFAEIPQKLRVTVIQMMDEANKNTKDNPLGISRELATQLLKDGVLHEDYHEKIYKHTEDDLKRAQQLLPKLYKGRLFFKNFIKALKGIQRFRLVERADDPEFQDPTEETWDLALRLFLAEMFCDLIPILLKRRVGETHVYESELGEVIPKEWEEFLNELIDRHINDYKNNQSSIYKRSDLVDSGYYVVRGINAS